MRGKIPIDRISSVSIFLNHFLSGLLVLKGDQHRRLKVFAIADDVIYGEFLLSHCGSVMLFIQF